MPQFGLEIEPSSLIPLLVPSFEALSRRATTFYWEAPGHSPETPRYSVLTEEVAVLRLHAEGRLPAVGFANGVVVPPWCNGSRSFLQLVEGRRLVVDVGAHVGMTSALMMQLFSTAACSVGGADRDPGRVQALKMACADRSDVQVLSLEANPPTFEALLRRGRHSGWDLHGWRAQLVAVTSGAEPGPVRIYSEQGLDAAVSGMDLQASLSPHAASRQYSLANDSFAALSPEALAAAPLVPSESLAELVRRQRWVFPPACDGDSASCDNVADAAANAACSYDPSTQQLERAAAANRADTCAWCGGGGGAGRPQLDGAADSNARRDVVFLLKVDAEGFDGHVLRGAEALLALRAVKWIVFEYGAKWRQPPGGDGGSSPIVTLGGTLAQLHRHGYRCFVATPAALFPVWGRWWTEAAAAAWSRLTLATVLCAHGADAALQPLLAAYNARPRPHAHHPGSERQPGGGGEAAPLSWQTVLLPGDLHLPACEVPG